MKDMRLKILARRIILALEPGLRKGMNDCLKNRIEELVEGTILLTMKATAQLHAPTISQADVDVMERLAENLKSEGVGRGSAEDCSGCNGNDTKGHDFDCPEAQQ